MTVVAVIADTHLPRGTRALPAGCVERLREADLVLHAGDFVSARFLQELRNLGPPVDGVHGNMDDDELLDSLPRQRVVEVAGARIGMLHLPGARAGREERLVARFPGCHAVVYGHTHVPQVERHGGVWILNPGSPTERRTAPVHAMLLVTIAGDALEPELVTF